MNDAERVKLEVMRESMFFKIAAACREGPAPDFCCIARVIAGKISKTSFWPPRGQELYLEVEAWRAPYTSSVIYIIWTRLIVLTQYA